MISWHRFYDPQTGSYISADPIGLRGGLNLYTYTGGDPINWIDPSGLAVAVPVPPPIVGGSPGKVKPMPVPPWITDWWDKIDPDSIPDVDPPIDVDDTVRETRQSEPLGAPDFSNDNEHCAIKLGTCLEGCNRIDACGEKSSITVCKAACYAAYMICSWGRFE